MSVRPLVTVQKENRVIPLPKVFLAPIRYDVIHFVHTLMRLNRRKPYAVSRRAGHKNSAESWGTGRAVARIPRISGGGTHRSGQGAFGNMCRGGHMFAPTKVFRRWNKCCNVKIRQMAVRAALAASAVPALVLARGHRIGRIPEVPLVVTNNFEKISKTRAAIKFLCSLGLKQDLLRCKYSTVGRAGKGKWRGRKFQTKKGPLVICNNRRHLHLALRNIPGVDLIHVKHLNLLHLCPGGHAGRIIVWTEAAFRRLHHKFRLYKPGHVVDSKRVVNSEEVQGVLRRKHSMKQKIKAWMKPKRLDSLNPARAVVSKIESRRQKQLTRLRAHPELKLRLKLLRIHKKRLWKARVLGLLRRDGKPVPGKEEELKKKFPSALKPFTMKTKKRSAARPASSVKKTKKEKRAAEKERKKAAAAAAPAEGAKKVKKTFATKDEARRARQAARRAVRREEKKAKLTAIRKERYEKIMAGVKEGKKPKVKKPKKQAEGAAKPAPAKESAAPKKKEEKAPKAEPKPAAASKPEAKKAEKKPAAEKSKK